MKFFLQILLFFLLITQIHYPQWTNQNLVPDGNDLWSTFFVDDITGWIVGSGGFIKKTTNAGNEWIKQNSGTTLILKSIQFVNQNTGWICGESGLILKSTNGGSSWFSLTSGTTQHLTDIHFYDADTGYVTGFGGTILKTTNGGLVWTSLNSGTTNDLYSMDFVDAIIGYAVGGGGSNLSMLKTTDGGTSWIDKSSGLPYTGGYCQAVDFINSNVGFIGGTGFLFKTTDGGVTWGQSELLSPFKRNELSNKEQLSPYLYFGNTSIYFKDVNNGWYLRWYGSDNYIYSTTDGGITWENQNNYWEDPLLSVFVTQNGTGLAVGGDGLIYLKEDISTYWVRLFSGPKDDIYSVYFVDENIGWAAGFRYRVNLSGGIVLNSTNGGKIWKTQLKIGSYPQVNSVYFINENMGWAIGEEMTHLRRTTDGGENWSSSGGGGSSVFFTNQDTGWVVAEGNYGDDPGIFKSTDGGITWTQKSSIRSSSVDFSDINNGWAVGAGGSILKSTDGGETWITKTSGTSNELKCIRFYNSSRGMCVGNAGTVLLSTDGGESWISLSSGTTFNLTSVVFTNSTTVWIAGYNGTILNTTDLGYNWTSYNGVTTKNLNSIFFVNEYTGWVGGMDGTMFKYEVETPPPPIWSNHISVKDAGGTESSQSLTFGQHIDATDSIDASLGEFELPPSPPTGIFEARFNLPTNPQVSSFIDYRDSAKTDIIWTMTFQPGSAGYPMTFSWDSTAFPEGTFYLTDRINGSFVNVNMKFKSSYILSNPDITSLNIIFDREGINPTAPSAPTNLIATADNYSVTLSWVDNSDNETGFIIERKDGDPTSVNPFIKIDTVATDETEYINTGLTPNTTYTYRVFAFNDFYISFYSNLAQITTPALPATFQLTVSLLAGWNMVSIPGLHPVNQDVETWWPHKTGTVWGFDGVQYVGKTTATPGEGYWMKNEGVEIYNYPAIQIVAHDSIEATSGWNMIGGYETSVATANLETSPPNQITGNIWGFNGIQYLPTLTLEPGYGYWVQVLSDCDIIIPDAMSKGSGEVVEYFKEDWGSITITDAAGISSTLYAVKGDSPIGGASVNLEEYSMPPLPPAGAFDIRFSSGRIAEDINSTVKGIDMTGVTYPLTIRVEGMDIRLMDETGKTVNLNLKSGEDIVISDATIQKLMVSGELIPAEYALEQNYPNPFNPSTVIEFSLPENVGNVKLSIYNTLGEKVAEIVNTSLTAGRYNYQWNAKNVATGIYIYELRTDKFVSVKKMMLLK